MNFFCFILLVTGLVLAGDAPRRSKQAPKVAKKGEKSGPKAFEETQVGQSDDIVTILGDTGFFNTLGVMLRTAGLTSVLGGEGPFTIFAPTDDAFASWPPGLLEDLMRPENKDKLIQILTYHILPGKIKSGDLESGKVKTVQGSDVDVRVSSAGVKVKDANVIIPDVIASNGVIQVIDAILLPSTAEAKVAALVESKALSQGNSGSVAKERQSRLNKALKEALKALLQ